MPLFTKKHPSIGSDITEKRIRERFILALDQVIQDTCRIVTQFNRHVNNFVDFPLILAYADDLLVISEKEKDLRNLLDALKQALRNVGFQVNNRKSTVNISDPNNKNISNKGQDYNIGDMTLKLNNKMKYLGTYLTIHLSRRETVKARTKTVYITPIMMLPFAENHQLP